MSVTWFKRYRMHFDLRNPLPELPDLPAGYELLPWDPSLLGRHAQAKYLSFRHEIDANVFPCLAEQAGCRQLMSEISGRQGFVPASTWLAICRQSGSPELKNCGTVQGINLREGEGSIQNLGVAPEHRGRGLARSLLILSLRGFTAEGLQEASLEVTARNRYAIDLYRRFGFRIVKSVYKSIEVVQN